MFDSKKENKKDDKKEQKKDDKKGRQRTRKALIHHWMSN